MSVHSEHKISHATFYKLLINLWSALGLLYVNMLGLNISWFMVFRHKPLIDKKKITEGITERVKGL